MDEKESESLQDDLDVEISDLDGGPGERRPPKQLAYIAALSRRHRVPFTLATAAIVILVLLVLVASATDVRQFFVRSVPSPQPTRAAVPLYYVVQANPPWGLLYVDGKKATLLPAGGSSTLVYLTPGQHELTWRAAPFVDQHCIFTVPVGSGKDTCAHPGFLQPSNVYGPPAARGPGATIRFPATLNQLPANQQAILVQAVQSALDNLDSRQISTMIRPGEPYAFIPDSLEATRRACKVLKTAVLCYTQATQQMKATLHFQLDTSTSRAAPCISDGCIVNGEDCRQFCDASAFDGLQYPVGPPGWHAFATVHLSWQYTSLDGSSGIEQDDTFIKGSQNEHFVPLVINWSGGKWQVTLLFPNAATPFGEPQCDFATGEVYTLLTARSSQTYAFTYRQLETMAAGCLVEIEMLPTLSDQPGIGPTPPVSPPAYFLHRFGVLLAANDEAHRLAPYLPQIDASERRLTGSLTG